MKTEYQVVCRCELADLHEDVNALLSEGWECQGGVSLSEYSSHYESGRDGPHTEEYQRWAQAMIKHTLE